MSDLPPSDDELLSAHLDGELTGEERAALEDRLGREPGLAARLAELGAAADLVATPVVPLAGDTLDDLVDAALAASSTSPGVTDLAVASAARRRTWGNRVAVAAATVLLVALAVPALRAIGDDDGSTETADVGDTDDAADGAAELELPGETADAATATFEESAPAADDAGMDDGADRADGAEPLDVEAADSDQATTLGVFADLDQLRVAAAEEYGTGSAPTTTVTGPDTPAPGDGDEGDGDLADPEAATACLGEANEAARDLLEGDDPPTPELTEAVVAGEPVIVALFPTAPGPTLVVTAADSCAVLDVAVLD